MPRPNLDFRLPAVSGRPFRERRHRRQGRPPGALTCGGRAAPPPALTQLSAPRPHRQEGTSLPTPRKPGHRVPGRSGLGAPGGGRGRDSALTAHSARLGREAHQQPPGKNSEKGQITESDVPNQLPPTRQGGSQTPARPPAGSLRLRQPAGPHSPSAPGGCVSLGPPPPLPAPRPAGAGGVPRGRTGPTGAPRAARVPPPSDPATPLAVNRKPVKGGGAAAPQLPSGPRASQPGLGLGLPGRRTCYVPPLGRRRLLRRRFRR